MVTYALWGLAVAFLLFVAFLIISSRFNWGRVDCNSEEVATIIENFIQGTGGEWDWDDFTSVPIRDPDLERIRVRCAMLHEQFPPTEPGTYCSPAGITALRAIVKQLRKGAA